MRSTSHTADWYRCRRTPPPGRRDSDPAAVCGPWRRHWRCRIAGHGRRYMIPACSLSASPVRPFPKHNRPVSCEHQPVHPDGSLLKISALLAPGFIRFRARIVRPIPRSAQKHGVRRLDFVQWRQHATSGVPRGIRTPVTAVKGRCPGPLDDGDEAETKKDVSAPLWIIGGASRDRTGDLLHAMQALSQLSYSPTRGAYFPA